MGLLQAFHQKSMKWKITVIVLLPITGYLALSLYILESSWNTLSSSAASRTDVQALGFLSGIIKELQIERGRSAVFVKSDSIKPDYLYEQRKKVDFAIEQASKQLESYENKTVTEAYSSAEERLKQIRPMVVAKAEPSKFVPIYTEMVVQLMGAMLTTVNRASADQRSAIRSLISLENARESSGLLRAFISSILVADRPVDADEIKNLILLDSSIKTKLDIRILDIDQADREKIGEFGQRPHWQAKEDTLNLIISLAEEGAYGEDGQETFTTLTKIVDDIGLLIQSQLVYVRNQVEQAYSGARQQLILIILGVLVLLGVMFSMFLTFLHRFEKSINGVVSGLNGAKDSLMSSSKKVRLSGGELTTSSHQASAAIQKTASSMTELNSMVERSLLRITEASDSTKKVSDRVKKGESSLDDLLDSMNKISDATNNLDEINEAIDSIATRTGVINDIVFKTQMLSFNASIEAEKAGEHGRGFAVVAEEVGKLADLSGKSASEISSLLQQSRKQIARSIKINQDLIKEGLNKSAVVNSVFKHIKEDVTEINANTTEVKTAANEQQVGLDEITAAVNQIDESVQHNVARAQDSEMLATQLIADNDRLVDATTKLVTLIYGIPSAKQSSPIDSAGGGDHQGKSEPTTLTVADNKVNADDESFHPAA